MSPFLPMPIFWDTATMQFSGRTMLAAGIKPYSLSLPSSLARNRSHSCIPLAQLRPRPHQGPPRILFVQLRPRPRQGSPRLLFVLRRPRPARPRPAHVAACARAGAEECGRALAGRLFCTLPCPAGNPRREALLPQAQARGGKRF